MISAVRASGAAPISQKTIASDEMEPPLLRAGRAARCSRAPRRRSRRMPKPANYWGYSYIRLRGIDQSRINLTLDGIPLNDPEDQVLYFADFPDLANSLQLGAGAARRRHEQQRHGRLRRVDQHGDAFRSPHRRATARCSSRAARSDRGARAPSSPDGLLPSRFAMYARVSALHTDGYRYHSGVEGRSLFFRGGYFGDRDIVKLTVTTGTMRDTMAYLAVAESPTSTRIAASIRSPPRERDGFGERLAALSYTRLLGPSSSLSTTAYRISASGDYDVLIDSLDNFNLKFVWYGVTSDWSYRRDALQLDVGVNANTYARDHVGVSSARTSTNPLYFNTGHKQDASGFAKLAYTAGRATLFGDVQARHAEFRYTPDAHAGDHRAVDRVVVSQSQRRASRTRSADPLSLYASYGKNTREPARNDMFAGFDNLDTSNVAVRRRPRSREGRRPFATSRSAPRIAGHAVDAAASTSYSMDFRNEIAPIGALSYIGTPLRQERRRELSARHRGRRHVSRDSAPRARREPRREHSIAFASYTDSTGDTPVTYHDVEPLLTPRFTTFERAQLAATRHISLALETRYTSRSFLQNNDDSRVRAAGGVQSRRQPVARTSRDVRDLVAAATT